MTRPIFVSILFTTAILLASSPATASHPTTCTPAVDGEAFVVLEPLTVNEPYCSTIVSGEKVTWLRADPFVPSTPESHCFSAREETGGSLGFAERYTVQFTWDAQLERIRIQAWDNDGQPIQWPDPTGKLVTEKLCHSGFHKLLPDGTLQTVWHNGFSVTGVINITP